MYNENGLRVQKTATSTGVTKYTLHGKNIVHMTKDKGQQHDDLHFFYDASNKPAIVEFNGTKYAYVHNLQGDIVAILDSNGTKVVEYKYDAWGKPFTPTGSMKDSLGKLNPFRYRGYVYDEETGLYYLRSRFYMHYCSRFLNSDAVIICRHSLLYLNQFSYCRNSPAVLTDNDGYEPVNEYDPLPYDRDKVIEYGRDKAYGRDPLYYYEANNNCARYASQCVYEGLGKPYYKDWHYFRKGKEDVTKSWRLVNKQFDFFCNLEGFSRGLVSLSKDSDFSFYIATYEIKPGDLMFFSYFSGGKSYDHTVLVSSVDENMIYYMGNTENRFDEPLTTFF